MLSFLLALFLQGPPGYYANVDTSSPAALHATLHEAIDDHTRLPYTSGGTDTWDVLELADQNPANSAQILDLYRNASYAKAGGGNPDYDREHTWPNSLGFPNDSASNYPYTDCHHLFLADGGYNSARGNKPYRTCDPQCTEEPTVLNGGQGGGSGVYPGNSNWVDGVTTTGTWETWKGRRGDVARAIFYMDVRYEGGTHGITGAAEPDLRVTDNQALISASNTGQNESVAYMGFQTELLAWHLEDPVDAKELARNEVVYGFQGNRNPFIDHPEWAAYLFGDGTLDTVLSANLSQLDLLAGGVQQLTLDATFQNAGRFYFLAGSTEGSQPGFSFNGFAIPLNPLGTYFTLSLSGQTGVLAPYFGLLDANGQASAQVSLPAGLDPALEDLVLTHAYVVLDNLLNVIAVSNAVDLTLVLPPPAPVLLINELDYDQASIDTGEFVELYNPGPAPLVLSNVLLELWNGSNNTIYKTYALSSYGPTLAAGAYLVLGSTSVLAGLPPNTPQIAFQFASDNLQNGAPDGLRLLQGTLVLDSVSYEGTLLGITEGASAPTDDPSQVQSLSRKPNATDTNNNAADFQLATPTPGVAN